MPADGVSISKPDPSFAVTAHPDTAKLTAKALITKAVDLRIGLSSLLDEFDRSLERRCALDVPALFPRRRKPHRDVDEMEQQESQNEADNAASGQRETGNYSALLRLICQRPVTNMNAAMEPRTINSAAIPNA